MQYNTVHYVEDNIIQCEILTESRILFITNKSIILIRKDAKKAAQAYMKINIQIPHDHNVEAA